MYIYVYILYRINTYMKADVLKSDFTQILGFY